MTQATDRKNAAAVGRARGTLLQRLQHLPDRLAVVIGGALRPASPRRDRPAQARGRRSRPGTGLRRSAARCGSGGGGLRARARAGSGRSRGERRRRRRGEIGAPAARRRVLAQVEGLLDRRHRRFGRILNSLRIVRHMSVRVLNALQGIAARTGPTLGPHSRCARAANPLPSAGRPMRQDCPKGSRPPYRHPNALSERMKPGSVTLL